MFRIVAAGLLLLTAQAACTSEVIQSRSCKRSATVASESIEGGLVAYSVLVADVYQVLGESCWGIVDQLGPDLAPPAGVPAAVEAVCAAAVSAIEARKGDLYVTLAEGDCDFGAVAACDACNGTPKCTKACRVEAKLEALTCPAATVSATASDPDLVEAIERELPEVGRVSTTVFAMWQLEVELNAALSDALDLTEDEEACRPALDSVIESIDNLPVPVAALSDANAIANRVDTAMR